MPFFTGPNGARFHAEPGAGFDQEEIDRLVKSGEWTPEKDSESKPAKKAAAKKSTSTKK